MKKGNTDINLREQKLETAECTEDLFFINNRISWIKYTF